MGFVLQPRTWALSLPLQGVPACGLGRFGSGPSANPGVVVGGWEENPDPSPAEAREEASGSSSDRFLSFFPHASRNTEKKVVKITSEISQMEVRFLPLLCPLC